MSKARTFAALVILLMAAAFVYLHYRNQFARVQRVEVESTPPVPGTLNRFIFRNHSSKKAEFALRCYVNTRIEGRLRFSQAVVLPPNASVEVDVFPEFAGRALPRMIENRACLAVWRGPFGSERQAWWVNWQPIKPPRKRLVSSS